MGNNSTAGGWEGLLFILRFGMNHHTNRIYGPPHCRVHNTPIHLVNQVPMSDVNITSVMGVAMVTFTLIQLVTSTCDWVHYMLLHLAACSHGDAMATWNKC